MSKSLMYVLFLLAIVCSFMTSGCRTQTDQKEVIVYVSLDRQFSEPILKRFEEETGITVRAKYDTESTKSVGFYHQILREKNRPRCDVFWNNELINTIRLKKENQLAEYSSPIGSEYPLNHRDPDHTWYGFAARARVILVNTDLVKSDEIPKSLDDLTDPKWKEKIGIAKPLFGSTATHFAALWSAWGEDRTKKWLAGLKYNQTQILPGNKQVAVQVGSGALHMGLTDTDDALAEIEAGKPVQMIYPHTSDLEGIFVFPNTLCLIKDSPNQEHAKKLIEFLLSPEIESAVASGSSKQIPLHPKSVCDPIMKTPFEAKHLTVDYEDASNKWNDAMQYLKVHFIDE